MNVVVGWRLPFSFLAQLRLSSQSFGFLSRPILRARSSRAPRSIPSVQNIRSDVVFQVNSISRLTRSQIFREIGLRLKNQKHWQNIGGEKYRIVISRIGKKDFMED